jgi:hypothetical protein
MKLDKIGEGACREVFQEGNGVCIKRLKKTRKKQIFGTEISLPMWFNFFFKIGLRDLNRFEFDNYKRLMMEIPKELQEYFSTIYSTRLNNGYSESICELITDEGGLPSKTLRSFGKIEDAKFWDILDNIRNEILARSVPYFGVHHENILVRQLANSLVPIFIDYKSFGMARMRFQPWLYISSERKIKIKRLFDKLNVYRDTN